MDRKFSAMRWSRLLAGKTIDELSMASGLDKALLSRAERGLYRLTPEQKTKIAQALNVSEQEIFGKDEPEAKDGTSG